MGQYEIDNIINLMKRYTNKENQGEIGEQDAPAAGGTSTIIPSVFIQGTRDDSSDAECTFDYGKRSGTSSGTVIHTQDNNTDTLNNMDELSVLLVM
jgi:hypothetical protein